MNRINPGKLLLSKWTARQPIHREKHFIVVECQLDELDYVVGVELQAVLTRRSQHLPWRALQDSSLWLPGWR